MKKAVLIDGNNLLFRSYYATAYSGSILRNSKGFPTNGLYGFINMLNKIIKELNPEYMMIAFDKGKTFRHEKYKGYKDGRRETPTELKQQFPVAKEIAKAMGIKCFEIDNYEADDIIGTFAKEVDLNEDFTATIVSSDKDLLQLISKDVDVKLLKMNDFIYMNEKTFFDTYGITPDKMIDLKGLMGDSSDNIPGVKGIGEKTALSLLKEYSTVEGVYENIDNIKGKTKEKLINDKDNAFFSKELATIYRDVPIDKSLDNIKYDGITKDYIPLLEEYEFYSIIKKTELFPKKEEKNIKINIYKDEKINDAAIYLEVKGNYHDKNILGMGVYDGKDFFIVEKDNIINFFENNKSSKFYTYDLKKLLVSLKYLGYELKNDIDDLILEAYILNYNIKDDISYIASSEGYDSITYDQLLKKEFTIEEINKSIFNKTEFIYDYKDKYLKELEKEEQFDLYKNLELPTTYVLADMEYTGILVDRKVLDDMNDEIKIKLSILEDEIYNLCGCEFNISSPKQLGKILFEKLQIKYPKKVKDGNYSTSVDILSKLKDYPVVEKVLSYRTLSKLYSTYTLSLPDYIKDDNRIHTIFNQTLTRTGRLSSSEPNLQNIPVRSDYGRLIRKAFIPDNDSILLSSDYSQIELRIFAHMSGAENLINAFKSGMDIHTKTAMDIYNVPEIAVTKAMRRNAKAVNFGILYGISTFGLAEDLGIDFKEAKKFIDDYLNTFPGIKEYMNSEIKEAKEKGYTTTLFGRKRIIEELSSTNFMVASSGERMALNTPIQGTSADILKKAMIEIFNKFNQLNLKSKMIVQVHDELVFNILNNEREIAEKIIIETMEGAYKLNVPLKVEINSGKNWYEAK